MPKKKLDARTVESLKPAATRYDVWDALLPAFGVRVAPTGRRTWIIATRAGGKKHARRVSIGTFPAMSLAAARERARAMMAEPEAQQPGQTPVREVLAEFIKRDQKPRLRSWASVSRILERELAPLLSRPIGEIRKRDVVELVNRVGDRGAPIMARRVHAHLHRMLAWAVEVDYLEASPASGARAPAASDPRDRVLSGDELCAVWRATELLGWPAGHVIRLLIVTGQRRSEVAGMAWVELDLEQALWTLPAARTKSNRTHEVPLPALAMSIIKALPRLDERLVFPGRSGGPTAALPGAKARLDQLSGVTGWRLHDLRRTVASGMAALGVAPHVIAEVLNHARVGVTAQVYDRHRYLAEKRAALEAWVDGLTTV